MARRPPPKPPRPNPPAHVAHFTTHGTQDGVAWANTFWVRNAAAVQPTPAAFDTFTQKMHELWLTAFLEHVNDAVRVNGTEGLYYGAAGADLGSSYARTDTGSQAGGKTTAATSTGISWRVQQHYKGGHPRTYLPAPAIVALTNTRLFTAAHTAACAAAGNTFLAAVNALSVGEFTQAHLGTVSFIHDAAWRTPPVFRDFIPGQAQCDARIDTVRHRLGRDL